MLCLNKPTDLWLDPHPLHIKQGTDMWFQLWRQAIFTGSMLYKGIGLAKLKMQAAFLEDALKKQRDPTCEDTVEANCIDNDDVSVD